MYNEAWKKYREGFKLLVPFILVKLLFQISNFKPMSGDISLDKYDMISKGGELFKNMTALNDDVLVISNILVMIISLLGAPLFYSFLYLMIKNIINDKEANFKEVFYESFQYYLRYLTLIIIVIAVLVGISFLAVLGIMIPFVIIPIVIFLIYMVIALTPCEAYLIYNNVDAGEAFSKGKALGKKYFWKLVLIIIISSAIEGIVDIIPNTNLIIYTAKSFITISIGFYMYVFAMILCKHEEI